MSRNLFLKSEINYRNSQSAAINRYKMKNQSHNGSPKLKPIFILEQV